MKSSASRGAAAAAILWCGSLDHAAAQTPQRSASVHVVACAASQPAVPANGKAVLTVFLGEGWVNPVVAWTANRGVIATPRAREAPWTADGQTGPVRVVVSVRDDDGAEQCVTEILVAPEAARGNEGALSYLLSTDSEPGGYGLYTYVLLSQEPSPATAGRYEQLMGAALRMVPGAAALERYLPRDELNRLSVPVTAAVGGDRSNEGRQMSAKELLVRYDYARARALLARIATLAKLPSAYGRGPYIVSVRRPLTTTAPDKILLQDFADIPPTLVSSWFAAFLNQTSKERLFEQRFNGDLALRLRTVLAQVALAQPPVSSALTTIIRWFE